MTKLPYLVGDGQPPTSFLPSALFFVERYGWWVFPLEVLGKRPLRGSHGLLDASNDPQTVRAWWNKRPYCNIGINCGLSRLLVIDVDPRNGGIENLQRWEQEHGALPPTPLQARTPSGGYHRYYQASEEQTLPRKGILTRGVDIQSVGGYVVAPPSETLAGEYQWIV